MFDKVVGFLLAVIWSGVVAFVLALLAGLILGILIFLAMIPVSIIFGDGPADWVMHAVDQVGFRVLYAIVFITVLLDELGARNIRAAFARWWKKQRAMK